MIKEMEGKNETHHPPCGKGKFCDMHILQGESLVFPSLSGHISQPLSFRTGDVGSKLLSVFGWYFHDMGLKQASTNLCLNFSS